MNENITEITIPYSKGIAEVIATSDDVEFIIEQFEGELSEESDAGAPTKYEEKYCEEMISYFENAPLWQRMIDSETCGGVQGDVDKYNYIPEKMPAFFRFAKSIGVVEKTLSNWRDENPEFLQAYEICKALQQEWITVIGMSGKAPAGFMTLIAVNVAGMKNSQSLEHTGKDGKDLFPQFTKQDEGL